MDYKMLVLDLDGTCLTSDYRITDELCSLIQRIKDDYSVHIVTGRSMSDAYRYQTLLGLTSDLVCYNGALIYDVKNNKPKYRKYMQAANNILKYLIVNSKYLGIENIIVSSIEKTYALNQRNQYLCEMMYDKALPFRFVREAEMLGISNAQRIVLSVEPTRKNEITKQIMQIFHDVKVYSWSGRDDIVDICMADVNKWEAVKRLMKDQHIIPELVIAVGDSGTDVDILKNVGMGICMRNGSLEARSVAKHITKYDNDQNGVFLSLRGIVG